MKKVLKSHWWAIFFIFFFPLLIIYSYVDFVRDSELNARAGWLLMMGGLVYIMRHTFMQKMLLVVLGMMALSGALDVMYASTFGGVFTSASLEAMLLTDAHESWDFLTAYASLGNITLLLFYVTVVYFSLRQLKFTTAHTNSQRFYVFLGVLMLVVAAQQIYQRDRFFDTVPGFVGTAIDFSKNREGMDKAVAARQALYANKSFNAVKQTDLAQTYVVVIGESMNRNHLGLYGYPRETTPNLAKLSAEFLRFDNVVSAFAQTSPSLKVALTEANLQNRMADTQASSLLEAAKKAGFKTWWISNQQPLRMPTTPIAALADVQKFISHDFNGVEDKRYDGYLLPAINDALTDKAAHKVIFVHLMGSHLQYRNRYPDEFEFFTTAENTKAYSPNLSNGQLNFINQYDNSIRYTDFVLSKVVEQLNSHSEIAALSFFADHGEEVFDSKDFKGHGPDRVTKNMLEIPFMLWRNSAYKTQFNTTEAILAERLNSPFMLDDYFEFGLCFMHIKSDLTRPGQSWCGADFKASPRIIYGKEYDKEWPWNPPIAV